MLSPGNIRQPKDYCCFEGGRKSHKVTLRKNRLISTTIYRHPIKVLREFYRLLVLLSGNISLNPGVFHNLQLLDNDKWNIFKHRGLYFLHLSINSLLPKIYELRHIARLTNPVVIGISESKLDDFVLTSEIQIDEYGLLRCDRNKHRGG